MILGAEIALIIYGIYALVRGSFSLGKGRSVTGNKARILGLLCLVPLPLSFCAGAVIGVVSAIGGGAVENFWLYTAAEFIILLMVIVIVSVLAKDFYDQQEMQHMSDETSS
jgi:hypothetical protein